MTNASAHGAYATPRHLQGCDSGGVEVSSALSSPREPLQASVESHGLIRFLPSLETGEILRMPPALYRDIGHSLRHQERAESFHEMRALPSAPPPRGIRAHRLYHTPTSTEFPSDSSITRCRPNLTMRSSFG